MNLNPPNYPQTYPPSLPLGKVSGRLNSAIASRICFSFWYGYLKNLKKTIIFSWTHKNSHLHDRVEIEQKSENKSHWSLWGDPKTVFESYPNPKNSPLWSQKLKNDPKISQNQMSKLKGTKKMKVVQLNEQTPKQHLNPNQTPKIAH